MGMSASQARFLGLTARKADNEYEAQQICQQRANLAGEMDMIATAYSNSMSNKQLIFNYVDPSSSVSKEMRLTYEIITSTDIAEGLSMRLVDTNGNVVVPNPVNTDAMRDNAYNVYQAALNNNCFEIAQQSSPSGPTHLNPLTGDLFAETFLENTNADTSNPIVDPDGNVVDTETLKDALGGMNANQFYEYWTQSGYRFQNNTLEDTEGVDSRLYTEDDAAARATYLATLDDINPLDQYHYTVDTNCLNPDYLEEMLRNGQWTLQKVNADKEWVDTSYLDQPSIEDAMYTADDSAAEALYVERSSFFKHQDQIMELRIKQLETEHNAIQTEMDSVKKVIEKNVESSFKTFG